MGLEDFLFPKKCLSCGRNGLFLCEECLAKTSFARNFCIECGRPAIDGMTHTKCIHKLGLDGMISFWCYEGVVKKAISTFKYKFAFEVGEELASNLIKRAKNAFLAFGNNLILSPIPLAESRERWRGFNQSQIVGKMLCQKLAWKYVQDLLIRTRYKMPQVGLRGKERFENIKDVFSLNLKYKVAGVKSTFILFDDVLTTGATLREAAKVLKRNGAEKVWGMTIAK